MGERSTNRHTGRISAPVVRPWYARQALFKNGRGDPLGDMAHAVGCAVGAIHNVCAVGHMRFSLVRAALRVKLVWHAGRAHPPDGGLTDFADSHPEKPTLVPRRFDKCVVFLDYIEGSWPKTAVVKTDPVPLAGDWSQFCACNRRYKADEVERE